MNSSQTLTHQVARTPEGRFAVVTPEGDTLAVVQSEFLAISCAAALDAEPVRTVEVRGLRGEVPRWDQPKAA